jgi:hypothetical protein
MLELFHDAVRNGTGRGSEVSQDFFITGSEVVGSQTFQRVTGSSGVVQVEMVDSINLFFAQALGFSSTVVDTNVSEDDVLLRRGIQLGGDSSGHSLYDFK